MIQQRTLDHLAQAQGRNTERFPLHGKIALTNACNLRCIHCYCPDHQARDEMTTRELERVLHEIAEAGCVYLTFTGGEVFARRDFKQLYEYALSLGFAIKLYTNATLITGELADYLGVRRPHSIEVSVYGADASVHDSVTLDPGSFEKTMLSVRRLRARGIRVKLKTILMKCNLHQATSMQDLARGLGCEMGFDPFVSPRLDGGLVPCELRPGPEDLVEFDMKGADRVSAWKQMYKDLHGTKRPPWLYICAAGRNSFYIDAGGRLRVCPRAPDGYDLRTGSFQEGWEVFLGEILCRKLDPSHPCARCERYYLCFQCTALARLENGSEYDPVPFLCRTAELKFERLRRAVAGGSECT